jgi:hypothetical protein
MLTGDDESSKSKSSSKLLEELEEIQKTPVATTRIVKLKLVIGCGCGGNYENIEREVPINSKFKDGDYVHDREKNDRKV